jgi:hypothetical protein
VEDTGGNLPTANFITRADVPITATATYIAYTAQSFPVRFLSPMARISFRLTEKIRWNAGYQYYGYDERFYTSLDYRAHTGYTSLLWSF